jgi:DNA-binding NarL/FixJ family response regulator
MPETAGRSIRLAVQSSHRLIRDALSAFFSGRPDFTVVGQTGSVESLYALCSLRRPDVTLVDAGPLTVELVESLRGLRATFASTEVVVAYSELTPQALDAAVHAGLTGLVPRSRGLDAVLRLLRQRANPIGRPADGLALTDRELEIISLLGAGHSVPQMAELLRISPRTVENHKRHLYAKLGVGSQSHAVSRATSLGLLESGVDPEDPGRPDTAGAPRAPLVVIRGSEGPCLDDVLVTLVGAGVPVVHARQRSPAREEHWARWHRGASAAILVDPTTDDWRLPSTLGAPTVVVYSVEPDLTATVDALLRGARALVDAADVRADLPAVLSLVSHGYFAMNTARVDALTDWMRVRFADGFSEVPELTGRERDILASIARGHTVRQTARALGIAAKTVENTQARLFRKLGAHNRAGALTNAYRLGLIDPAAWPSGA